MPHKKMERRTVTAISRSIPCSTIWATTIKLGLFLCTGRTSQEDNAAKVNLHDRRIVSFEQLTAKYLAWLLSDVHIDSSFTTVQAYRKTSTLNTPVQDHVYDELSEASQRRTLVAYG